MATIEMKTEDEKQERRLPMWVVLTAFIVLFGFLALIYWGLNRAQKGPVGVGDKAPAFELVTFDGDIIDTDDLQGKVIVVNFWASWCKPCEQEAAELEEAWRYYQPEGQVVFLGVDYVDTEPKALGYLEKFDVTYPNGADLRTEISQAYRIRGVPETYIIDRSGTLAYVKIGPFVSLDEILDAVDTVLAQ